MNQDNFYLKKIVEEYLNNINISQKYAENYKTFLNLISFLDKINNLDIDDIFILENSKIQDLVRFIVNHNIDKIKNKKINEICSNEIGVKLIDTYCILNDVYECDIQLFSGKDIVSTHLNLISKFPILSKEEEKDLFNKYYNGDEDAKTKLITSNLKLVVNIAKRYKGRGVDLMDLIQDGNNKLIDIVEKFDINKNCRFSSYAYISLKRQMERSLSINARNIRISAEQFHELQKYFAVRNSLEKRYNRDIENEEIAKELKWSIEKVRKIEELQFDTYSLNTIILEDDHNKDKDLESIIPSDDIGLDEVYETKEIQNNVKKLLIECGLSEREIYILINRFNDVTQEDIAKQFGLTRERIRQIEANAIKKIRKNKKTDKFAIYMNNEDEALKYLEEQRKLLKKSKKKK